jgi:hypothetical protein
MPEHTRPQFRAGQLHTNFLSASNVKMRQLSFYLLKFMEGI